MRDTSGNTYMDADLFRAVLLLQRAENWLDENLGPNASLRRDIRSFLVEQGVRQESKGYTVRSDIDDLLPNPNREPR